MKLWSQSWTDGQSIPARYAAGQPDERRGKKRPSPHHQDQRQQYRKNRDERHAAPQDAVQRQADQQRSQHQADRQGVLRSQRPVGNGSRSLVESTAMQGFPPGLRERPTAFRACHDNPPAPVVRLARPPTSPAPAQVKGTSQADDPDAGKNRPLGS